MSALRKSIGEGSGGKAKSARSTSRRAPAPRRSGTKKRA
jgi:hypothetical protein